MPDGPILPPGSRPGAAQTTESNKAAALSTPQDPSTKKRRDRSRRRRTLQDLASNKVTAYSEEDFARDLENPSNLITQIQDIITVYRDLVDNYKALIEQNTTLF
ncbi:hypothetical protein EG329_010045 [Mollisiaceae sp. DMI_Dod_QoI]|nr:hypothetical protein EG329_010045 [Helotiales sp. DMI_Dod_QoI]